MDFVLGLFICSVLILNVHGLARRLPSFHWTCHVLHVFLLVACWIVLSGFVLSELGLVGSLKGWVGSIAFLTVGGYFVRRRFPRAERPMISSRAPFSTLELLLLASFVGILILQLLHIAFTYPMNFDGLAYQVARVAYYRQIGHLGYFDANYWCQEVHPYNAALFQLFFWVSFGLLEAALKFPQFISYWITGLAIYGTARLLYPNYRAGALMAAGGFLYAVIAVLESVTVQNDLMLQVFVALSVFYLMGYHKYKRALYLVFAILSICLSIGVKANALLVVPLLGLLGLYVLYKQFSSSRKGLLGVIRVGGFASVFGLLFLLLPAGYMTNVRVIGHPIMNDAFRHSVALSGSAKEVFAHGSRNLMRYGIEFINFDGLPAVKPLNYAQEKLKAPFRVLAEKVGMDLENPSSTRQAFTYWKYPKSDEETSGWGALGFLLILPVSVFWLLWPKSGGLERTLAACVLGELFLEAFSGQYDPYRGRHYILMACFSGPLIARICFLFSTRKTRIILFGFILLGASSAVSTLLTRSSCPLIPYRNEHSVFFGDRLFHLTRMSPNVHEALVPYEELVPEDARVGLLFPPNKYEYVFFGATFSRRLIPIRKFWEENGVFPEGLDYILLHEDVMSPSEGFDYLGSAYYLKKLKVPLNERSNNE